MGGQVSSVFPSLKASFEKCISQEALDYVFFIFTEKMSQSP
ncbi:hypothetical protein SAMN06296386_103252 [Lachnospiraceae bacterium]|nr:hypothetical protein SAMN06296386_103252 [Lachnospiraceae bacterium]